MICMRISYKLCFSDTSKISKWPKLKPTPINSRQDSPEIQSKKRQKGSFLGRSISCHCHRNRQSLISWRSLSFSPSRQWRSVYFLLPKRPIPFSYSASGMKKFFTKFNTNSYIIILYDLI